MADRLRYLKSPEAWKTEEGRVEVTRMFPSVEFKPSLGEGNYSPWVKHIREDGKIDTLPINDLDRIKHDEDAYNAEHMRRLNIELDYLSKMPLDSQPNPMLREYARLAQMMRAYGLQYGYAQTPGAPASFYENLFRQ